MTKRRLSPAARRVALGLFAGGAIVRGWFMACDRPGFVGYPDARTFIIAADRSLFGHPCRPAGYPLFLRVVRRCDGRLSVTTAAQHGLGLLTASALYFATAPFLARRWLGLLPASVVLLGGTQLCLEHSVMSEAPYTALLCGALLCATRSIGAKREPAWLAACGCALGASATLRSSGVMSLPPLMLWTVSRPGCSPGRTLGATAALAAGAALALSIYTTAHHAQTGCWSLIRTQGFTLYARMAPIANPRRFSAPPGTEALCESSEPAGRPNPTWYMFAWPEAPALALFGPPPYPRDGTQRAGYDWPADRLLLSFARRVLRRQPGSYLASVGWSLANYVRPHTGPPSAIGWDHRTLIAELHNDEFEQAARNDIASYYDTGRGSLSVRRGRLDGYARAARLEGGPTGLLAALSVAGWIGRTGPERRGASLFAGTSLSMAASLAALLFYDARYATPLYGPLTAAAALGVDRLLGVKPTR